MLAEPRKAKLKYACQRQSRVLKDQSNPLGEGAKKNPPDT